MPMEGPSLLELPEALLIDLLVEWLKPTAVGRVDSAYCNHKYRPQFVNILKRDELIFPSINDEAVSADRQSQLFKWVNRRTVKCSKLVVDSFLNFNDAKVFIETVGQHVRRFDFSGYDDVYLNYLLAVASMHCPNIASLRITGFEGDSNLVNDLIQANRAVLHDLEVHSAGYLLLDLKDTQLKTLKYQHSGDFNSKFLTHCESLVQLDISGCWLGEGAFVYVAKYCPHLRELFFREAHATDEDMLHVGTLCTQLTSIDFSNNYSVTDQGMLNLVAHCTHLQHLQCEHNIQFTNRSLQYITTYLSGTLTTLSVDGCPHFSACHLAHLLELCTKLTRLSTSISEHACRYLVKASNLVQLDLFAVSLSEEVYSVLSQHCTNLQTLSLIYCMNERKLAKCLIIAGCAKLTTIKVTYKFAPGVARGPNISSVGAPNVYRQGVLTMRKTSNTNNMRTRW